LRILVLDKLFVAILMMLLLTSVCYAQNQKIDSLKKDLIKEKIDSNKVKTYYRLGLSYVSAQDSAGAASNFINGINLAKKNKKHLLVVYGYNEIGYLYELTSNLKTALNYYLTGIKYGEENSIFRETARGYINLSFVYGTQLNNNKSIEALEKALNIYEKAGDRLNQAGCLNNLGAKLLIKKDYDKALEYYFKAQNIYLEIGEKRNIGNTYLNIGEINYYKKNFDIATNYYKKAKEIADKSGDINLQILARNNQLAILNDQKKYNEAIPQYLELISLSNNKNKNVYALSLNTLASCYSNTGDLKNAAKYFKLGIDYALKYDLKEAILLNYVNSADLLIKEKQLETALENLFKSLAIVKKHSEFEVYKAQVYESIANTYKLKNDFEKAFLYQDSQILAKDFYTNISSNNKLLELQTLFDTNQKEFRINLLNKTDSIKSLTISKNLFELAQQKLALSTAGLRIVRDSLTLFSQNQKLFKNRIEASEKSKKISELSKEALLKELELQQKQLEINKKNTTIIIVSISAILILFIGYAIYRRQQLKQEAILASEKATQREVITKAVIDAEENERKRIASDLHDGVGQMFSAVKMNLNGLIDRLDIQKKEDLFLAEKTMALVDESCKEVRVISHKMMPNFLLKSGIAADIKSFIQKIDEESLKISFETQGFSDQLEYSEEVILYRVIQELINNVIKHAKATHLNILLQKTKNEIFVEISDNGIGFDYTKISQMEGLGLKNIKVRIDYLKGKFEYVANQPKGTTVKINIPLA
jgi:signal transduction histidine kinase